MRRKWIRRGKEGRERYRDSKRDREREHRIVLSKCCVRPPSRRIKAKEDHGTSLGSSKAGTIATTATKRSNY
jgi:hypothetical protein